MNVDMTWNGCGPTLIVADASIGPDIGTVMSKIIYRGHLLSHDERFHDKDFPVDEFSGEKGGRTPRVCLLSRQVRLFRRAQELSVQKITEWSIDPRACSLARGWPIQGRSRHQGAPRMARKEPRQDIQRRAYRPASLARWCSSSQTSGSPRRATSTLRPGGDRGTQIIDNYHFQEPGEGKCPPSLMPTP